LLDALPWEGQVWGTLLPDEGKEKDVWTESVRATSHPPKKKVKTMIGKKWVTGKLDQGRPWLKDNKKVGKKHGISMKRENRREKHGRRQKRDRQPRGNFKGGK